MKTFLAKSDQDEDKKIVEQIKEFIGVAIKGIQLVPKEPKHKRVWPEIEKTINACHTAIAILTKESQVKGDKELHSRCWPLTEAAYCMGKGYRTVIFVEKGISKIGLLGEIEYIDFSRDKNNQLKIDKSVATKILKSVFIPFENFSYSFDFLKLKVFVSNSGHGIMEESVILYKPPGSDFKKVKHDFSIIDVPGKLPTFQKLTDDSYPYRFDKHTLFARILDDKNKKRKIHLEESNKSTSRKKIFHISFLPDLKTGEKIGYAWGWSCPKIYLTKKSPFHKGYDDEAVIEITRPTDKLCAEIFFEEGFPILGFPWIEITDSDGNSIKGEKADEEYKLPMYQSRSLYGTSFMRDFDSVHQNSRYRILWKLK